MAAKPSEIGDFLSREDITPAEKLVIKWQFRLCGHFETALWNAIMKADEDNLDRLARGFPIHIIGYRAWAYGDPYSMGQKLRNLGLKI